MMDPSMLENAYPELHGRMPDRLFSEYEFSQRNLPVDDREVYDHIRDIKDPEHPMSLEELGVVRLDLVKVDDKNNTCCVEFKPTIPHCSMATLIGLCIKVQLMRLLPSRFKIDVKILEGAHSSYTAINKQLSDKERVAAALENAFLLDVLNDCLMQSERQTLPNFVENELQKSNSLDHPKIVYIQLSRQHIESYRRWSDVLASISHSAS